MRQSHKFLEAIDMSFYRRYLQQLLVIFTTLVFSSYTIAAVTCDAGFVSDEFAPADYGNLGSSASPPVLGINQLLNGIKNESYIIASNSLNTVATGTLETRGSNFYRPKTLTGGVESFELFQDFTDKAGTRTVSYTFNNKFTEKPQALKNVSLSIYDIDANYARTGILTGTRYFEFSDQVTITGITSSGTSVIPIRKYSGAGMTTTAPYRQTTSTSSVLCATDSVDEKCKVSVAFDQPVVRVNVTYGNNPDLEYYGNNNYFNPGDQLINIVFDGYCYKPQPRLTYRKELSTSRKKNTDQFTVQIKDNADNSVVTSGITTTTTTGTGNTITNGTGTTGTFKVDPTKTYTLTELASGNTNLIDYTASYTCKRSNGEVVTTLDPNNLQMTYGDNWNCTVNNSPNYVFSGIVFNDNGGIVENNSSNLDTNTKSDISSRFTGNNNYFNGKFEREIEQGIYASGLQVRLTDCGADGGADGGTNIAGTTAKNVSDAPATLGQFKFTVPASALAGKSRVCLVQTEPSAWKDSGFSIDTTSNSREVTLVNGTLDYKTENDGSRNLDFGEVKANYASLVLIKSQHVNDCDINANYDGIFSTSEIDGIEPGRCIAYKIDAYNRGHVDLNNIEITDKLQSQTVTSSFTMPLPKGIPATLYNNTSLPSSGTITSNIFNLDKPTGTSATKATLYFNTKYGTTISN